MTFRKFDPIQIEKDIQAFWDKNDIYSQAKSRNKNKTPFYFLDGPPYTSGKVHLGTAWNKSLKDAIIRYKRMKGFDVWDRAGYDMHGLPTEQGVEKELGIKKDKIPEYGVDKFIKKCEEFCLKNLDVMNQDFKRMGVWMDFDNAYQSITPEFIEGVWWLIKQAHDKGRLYKGFRTTQWDYEHQTALAKHELIYKTVTDKSIYVKFKIKGTENEYLVIWTTTPWTIPFNLAVMINPDIDYITAQVDDEIWFVAKELALPFINEIAEKEFNILDEIKGQQLVGTEYIHPLATIPELNTHYQNIKQDSPKTHTVLESKEYVTTQAGTGLVHCAPGCGPEDYEVGHKNGIQPFNTLKETGHFDDSMGELAGKHALHDNDFAIELIEKNGALVAQQNYEHEYPHGERSKAPIIFRATQQWFFKVEDRVEEFVQTNKSIKWIPEAAFNAFDAWLNNLRDNSITKQRYWGTPIPIWVCDKTGEYEVIGSRSVLEGKAGSVPDNLHKPFIDDVTYKSPFHPEGTMKRIPDILDVWVDAGTAAWNCLDYPQNKEHFDKLFPADFILEGKDQIRGWFNLLYVASMLGFDKPSFKACYMHGFINDSQGRKMSKSLGNYILPQEVIDEYGADTMRYYMIGGANPAVDLNYDIEHAKTKMKNLGVLWNVHNYLLQLKSDLQDTATTKPLLEKNADLDLEEYYILSRLHTTIKNMTDLFDNYKLNETPSHVESLFLDLSRTYIQLVRDKANTAEGKKTVHDTIFTVFINVLKLLAPIAPFITEQMYQNLKEPYNLSHDSIHHTDWPESLELFIDEKLEAQMARAQEIVQNGLALREKIKLGVRWPLKEVIIVTTEDDVAEGLDALSDIIKSQLNVKAILVKDFMHGIKTDVKIDYGKLGPAYGDFVPKIIAHLTINSPETILGHIQKSGEYVVNIEDKKISLKEEHLRVTKTVPLPFHEAQFKGGFMYLNEELNDELEAEGYAREIMRRVQNMRKKAGMQKSDTINLAIKTDEGTVDQLSVWKDAIKEKVGAREFRLAEKDPAGSYSVHTTEKIKGREFELYVEKVEVEESEE